MSLNDLTPCRHLDTAISWDSETHHVSRSLICQCLLIRDSWRVLSFVTHVESFYLCISWEISTDHVSLTCPLIHDSWRVCSFVTVDVTEWHDSMTPCLHRISRETDHVTCLLIRDSWLGCLRRVNNVSFMSPHSWFVTCLLIPDSWCVFSFHHFHNRWIQSSYKR